MAKENLAESGLGNPVAAVLFVFRALDTLLEKVVLLLALVGVWSLASDSAWGGVPALRVYASPSRILVFLDQILPPIGIMIGIYHVLGGREPAGRGFPGRYNSRRHVALTMIGTIARCAFDQRAMATAASGWRTDGLSRGGSCRLLRCRLVPAYPPGISSR